ncbi:uncharacterized protein LOC122092716 [Macadamia integrifolia]|uniref:uncharacterized protein LOC122092716 n=1 Tax=Macadamia integrifolia TaxID=60698 RepID=UPI001C52EE5C|nr:uncharacterized protein LOC122092716 [Macadamia integrifolia]
MTETENEMPLMPWGTWEELLLGGAVLRHGTGPAAWDAIAAELQARSLHPCSVTAEVCKAKYEDLQERFCGCAAWFEKLRKQRVAELKRDLEISEGSIGSLESKLESLKAEREGSRRVEYDSSRTESPLTVGNSSEAAESSGKEASKDGLSAGSFTEENTTVWSPKCHVPAVVSPPQENNIIIKQEPEPEPESAEDTKREKTTAYDDEKKLPMEGIVGVQGGCVRKRRGKRKRKDCTTTTTTTTTATSGSRDVKEGSVGENDVSTSGNVAVTIPDKEDAMNIPNNREVDEHAKEGRGVELMGILDLLMENDCASAFRRRLDSQRRARYKRSVRRHLDMETIRSRIVERSITSTIELYRDVLLLANNAVVFYPKNTRQYKLALSLRDLAGKIFRRIPKDTTRDTTVAAIALETTTTTEAAPAPAPAPASTPAPTPTPTPAPAPAPAPVVTESPKRNPTVKPRSARPYNRKVVDGGKFIAGTQPREDKKARDAASSPAASTSPVKKGVGRPAKSGRGGARKRAEVPVKARKRARRS